ncbi:methyltransferase family protein [Flavobacterium amniphilum]|uniref:methyltransferase family protein n=1 Tax=Flavobacterium amniphilum TaxID=1834035 RepID=UPI00374D46EA
MRGKSLISLVVRNLFFTVLQPGLVVGLFPYLIIGKNYRLSDFQLFHYVGLSLFLIGLGVLFYCIIKFIFDGFGTISPLDSSKRLVVSGLYNYSRNPMYIGVILALIGETIFFDSFNLLCYTSFVFLGFNLFVIFIEEPRLKRDFRMDYKNYLKSVRRWL